MSNTGLFSPNPPQRPISVFFKLSSEDILSEFVFLLLKVSLQELQIRTVKKKIIFIYKLFKQLI